MFRSGPIRTSRAPMLSIVIILLGAAWEADVAVATPAVSFTAPGYTADPPGQPVTDGWTFNTTSPIWVISLGVYDMGGNGFAESHPVAIWTSQGVQLASTTVSNAHALAADWFRYASITPLLLSPGSYVIGDFRSSGADGIAAQPQNFQTAPEIVYGHSMYRLGPALAMPTTPAGMSPAGFGPNFLFVPEPAGLALLALAALVLRRRRA